MNDLLTSEVDEKLLRSNLLNCYGTKTPAFRVSKEHYRYLAEQIIALRVHLRRSQGEEPGELAGEKIAEAEH